MTPTATASAAQGGFPSFPRLPAELRLRIWREACKLQPVYTISGTTSAHHGPCGHIGHAAVAVGRTLELWSDPVMSRAVFGFPGAVARVADGGREDDGSVIGEDDRRDTAEERPDADMVGVGDGFLGDRGTGELLAFLGGGSDVAVLGAMLGGSGVPAADDVAYEVNKDDGLHPSQRPRLLAIPGPLHACREARAEALRTIFRRGLLVTSDWMTAAVAGERDDMDASRGRRSKRTQDGRMIMESKDSKVEVARPGGYPFLIWDPASDMLLVSEIWKGDKRETGVNAAADRETIGSRLVIQDLAVQAICGPSSLSPRHPAEEFADAAALTAQSPSAERPASSRADENSRQATPTATGWTARFAMALPGGLATLPARRANTDTKGLYCVSWRGREDWTLGEVVRDVLVAAATEAQENDGGAAEGSVEENDALLLALDGAWAERTPVEEAESGAGLAEKWTDDLEARADGGISDVSTAAVLNARDGCRCTTELAHLPALVIFSAGCRRWVQ